MSIYDGKCDFGSRTAHPCPHPATRYADSSLHAYCENHGESYRRLEGTWTEVAREFAARQRQMVEAINQAERKGMLLQMGCRICSPRQARAFMENGLTCEPMEEVDPNAIVTTYENQAAFYEFKAQALRSEAKGIKGEMAKMGAVGETV